MEGFVDELFQKSGSDVEERFSTRTCLTPQAWCWPSLYRVDGPPILLLSPAAD